MTVHWCGTGLSAVPGLRRLLERGHEVKVWNRTPERARAAVGDLTDRIAAFDPGALKAEAAAGDVVISMLPGDWHAPLATACIERGAHFVSSSYIPPEIRALHGAALDRGVCLVNEIGLDPGIDHLMAHRLVADFRASGADGPGCEISFVSYCGGVPKDPNPFRYKFSWSPLGVLKALRSPSRSIRDFAEIRVGRPWEAISTYTAPLDPPEAFEVYPNRDSLPFIEEYGFDPNWRIREFVRGTLRLEGWAAAWRGIFDGIEALGEDAGEDWLADTSKSLQAEHAYAEGEPDRCVLCVALKAEREGRTVWHRTFAMDAWGDARGSAMARLVSVPVSLAVEAALAGELPAGVCAAPSQPHLVARFLDEVGGLAQRLGVVDHLGDGR